MSEILNNSAFPGLAAFKRTAMAGLVSLALCGLGAGVASAADIAEERFGEEQLVEDPKRNWALSPYFWMTIYNGGMTVNGQTVNMSGKTVFDLLNAGSLNFPPLVLIGEWDGMGMADGVSSLMAR